MGNNKKKISLFLFSLLPLLSFLCEGYCAGQLKLPKAVGVNML